MKKHWKKEKGLREVTIQSCEANHRLALHMCTVLSYGKHSQSAYNVIPLLSYEIQIISTIACVWSSLALARVFRGSVTYELSLEKSYLGERQPLDV